MRFTQWYIYQGNTVKKFHPKFEKILIGEIPYLLNEILNYFFW